MRGMWLFPLLLCYPFLGFRAVAQCAANQDHRSDKNVGVIVTDVKIIGTRSLSTDDLATITSSLIGGCFDDNSEDLQEWIRSLFQDRGYFHSTVNTLQVTPEDSLVRPTRVELAAEVTEGAQFTMAGIHFTGNRAFDEDELRQQFSIKKGDLFQRGKIATGLEEVRRLYATKGYLDMMMIVDVQESSNGTVFLTPAIEEGQQYHLREVEILAKPEVADKLRARWQMPEGAIFNSSYLDDFMRDNGSLLPANFTRDRIQFIRNCPDASVQVRVAVDEIVATSHPAPRAVECEKTEQ